MPISTPDWLTLRGGELRPSKDALSCIVVLNGQLGVTWDPRTDTFANKK